MFSYYHSPTSTPMSDVGSNIFIVGKYYFSKSHCSIGTFIKSSYSTHNIFSLWGYLSLFDLIVTPNESNVKGLFLNNQ